MSSRNVLDFYGQVFRVNLKGNADGEITNGKQDGELDVTLPNDLYFAAKFDRVLTNVKDTYNGHFNVEAELRENKNAPGKKVLWKSTAKDVNFDKGNVDLTYKLSAECAESGKNVHVDVALKETENTKSNAHYSVSLAFNRAQLFKLRSIVF